MIEERATPLWRPAGDQRANFDRRRELTADSRSMDAKRQTGSVTPTSATMSEPPNLPYFRDGNRNIRHPIGHRR